MGARCCMGKITKQDLDDSALQVHGAGEYVSKTFADSLLDQAEEKEQKLRGHLQNCVNHLEKAKRGSYGKEQKVYEDCIEQANKALYETLHT